MACSATNKMKYVHEHLCLKQNLNQVQTV